MDTLTKMIPAEICDTYVANTKAYERDLVAKIGISEAELIAAHCGVDLSRFSSRPFQAMFAMKEIESGKEIHSRVSA